MNYPNTIYPKGFYLLEYFYVLLKSIERFSDLSDVFEEFKVLKLQYRLGESKYKIKVEIDSLSKTREDRYFYTFRQVIEEAKDYDLVTENAFSDLQLTEAGIRLLLLYKTSGIKEFNFFLFHCMESKYGTFRNIIEFLYAKNDHKPGLLIFPNYSPRQLHFERSNVKTTADIIKYSEALTHKLEEDILNHLGIRKDLKGQNEQLLTRLIESNLLTSNPSEEFGLHKYNVITKRFRDFWISYFLREVYKFDVSLTTFDRWIYRGKQIGIIYATEFYPNFTGRIVYPTSVIVQYTPSKDFRRLFDYPDGKGLYIHEPVWDDDHKNKFVSALVSAYFDLRRTNRSYFINLLALRELVCYNLKISEYLFETSLGDAYRLNLAGKLSIKFSLEVDKLPEETKAMYLKQEPVMVDGKYRNIIGIDLTRGERYEQTITETVTSRTY